MVGDTWVQIGKDIFGQNEDDQFGYSVSLNSDGSVIAIGTPRARNTDTISPSEGYVRILTSDDNNWIQVGEDIEGQESFDRLGVGVSISKDSSKLAVGTDCERQGVKHDTPGRVKIFHLSEALLIEDVTSTQFKIYSYRASTSIN